MSLVEEYKLLEQQLQELESRRKSLESSEQLKRELEFESKLRALLSDYGMNLRNVIGILDPQSLSNAAVKPIQKERKPREGKTYTNPHTGEKVTSKGGPNAILASWADQYGKDVVKGWAA